MAVNFPDTSINNPDTGAPWANGDTFEVNNVTYVFNDDGTNPAYWSVQINNTGGGGTPDLQDVTDEGNTTTNSIVSTNYIQSNNSFLTESYATSGAGFNGDPGVRADTTGFLEIRGDNTQAFRLKPTTGDYSVVLNANGSATFADWVYANRFYAETWISGGIADTDLQFYGADNSTQGMKLLKSGALEVEGNVTAPNLPDDYEEGTWTPQLRFGGTSNGITGTQLGSYTKIGNRVYILCCVVLTSKGTSTGGATIEGLPFTSVGANTYNYHNTPLSVTFFSLNSLDGGSARTKADGDRIDLFQLGKIDSLINDTHLNNTSQIQIAGFYETNV